MNLSNLELERNELTNKIEKINIQLADNNRIDPETQERLTGRQYLEWRQGAQTAKRHKLARLREVNQEIKRVNKETQEENQKAIHTKLDRIIELLEEEYEDEPVGR